MVDESCTPVACQKAFDHINYKLDRIDKALRSNGEPGMVTRIDRLEQTDKRSGKLGWILIGAAITVISGLVVLVIKNEMFGKVLS